MSDDEEKAGEEAEAPETPEAPAAEETAETAEAGDGGDDDMAAAMAGQEAHDAATEGAEGAGDGEGDTGAESAEQSVELEELSSAGAAGDDQAPIGGEEHVTHTAAELEPVYDVPVTVQAVLGKAYLEVSQLLKLGPGAIVELDRKVGEAIDIYVNDRLVARGEVVLVEDHLGVTMTEIIKSNNA